MKKLILILFIILATYAIRAQEWKGITVYLTNGRSGQQDLVIDTAYIHDYVSKYVSTHSVAVDSVLISNDTLTFYFGDTTNMVILPNMVQYWTADGDDISNTNAGQTNITGTFAVDSLAEAASLARIGTWESSGQARYTTPAAIVAAGQQAQATDPADFTPWVRDSANQYVILAHTPDFVGIGTETPASKLDIYTDSDSVKQSIITIRNGSYLAGLSADTKNNLAFGNLALNSNNTGQYNVGIGWHTLKNNTSGEQNTAIGNGALELGRFGIANTAVGYLALNNLDTNSSTNVAVGSAALRYMTQGACNTAVGSGALTNQSHALDNTAVGSSASYSITTGEANTSIGTFSLSQVTTGNWNTAAGFHALDSAGTGTANVGVGAWAGWRYKNISYTISLGYLAAFNQTNSADNSQPNIAIGKQALYGGVDSTGTGYDNINIGTGSGYKSTHGFHNIGIGYNSLYSSIFGQYNVGIGYRALYTNTTGTANVAIGPNALYTNATGADNTAVGNAALNKNTASFNVGIGALSANQNTSGIRNTALGNSALEKNTTYSDNTAIGTYALRYHIAAENTAVGSQALNGSSGNSTGGQNTAVGYSGCFGNRTGNHNTVIGYSGFFLNQSGSYNIALGNMAGYKETGNYKFYLAADSTSWINGMNTGSKLLMYADQSNADKANHFLNIFGKVAIGAVKSPAYMLDVTGESYFSADIWANDNLRFIGAGTIYTSGDGALTLDVGAGIVEVKNLLKITPQAAAPSSPAEGWIYSNSTDHHLYFYNGTGWVQLDN